MVIETDVNGTDRLVIGENSEQVYVAGLGLLTPAVAIVNSYSSEYSRGQRNSERNND